MIFYFSITYGYHILRQILECFLFPTSKKIYKFIESSHLFMLHTNLLGLSVVTTLIVKVFLLYSVIKYDHNFVCNAACDL